MKSLKTAQHKIAWQTALYAIMAMATVLFAFIFDAWRTNWAQTLIVVVALVLFLDIVRLTFQHHHKAWLLLKWVIFILMLAFLLIGFYQFALP